MLFKMGESDFVVEVEEVLNVDRTLLSSLKLPSDIRALGYFLPGPEVVLYHVWLWVVVRC